MSKKIIQLKKGEELFSEGDEPTAMYIIQKGRLAIVKKKGNTNISLAELKPGDLLGEMTFFDKAPRSAGAVAIMDGTEVIELPFSALDQQWEALPAWVKSIVKAVNGHLRQANTKIRQLERTKEEEKEMFPSLTINALMAILGSVTLRYGEKTEEGLLIPSGKLRNYTIQVFQLPTSKMQLLCETLAGLGYMSVENEGEDKVKMVVKNVDFIYRFVDFYNNQLFSEQAKKFNINEKQLKTLKVAQFYGAKAEKNGKGFVKVNLTQISNVSMQEMGEKLSLDEVRSLSEIGILGDYSKGEDGDQVEFDITYVTEITPYWELIHKLKSFQYE